MREQGEEVIRQSTEIAREHNLPLMVHFGDGGGDLQRMSELTKLMLNTFTEGDILDPPLHAASGRYDGSDQDGDEAAARSPARRASAASCSTRRSGEATSASTSPAFRPTSGSMPDTTSSDLTLGGRTRGVGLLDSMSKFLAVGYSLSDVVRMAHHRTPRRRSAGRTSLARYRGRA